MAVELGGFIRLPAPGRPTWKHSPSHLALLVSTFKAGSEEPALCRGSPEGSTLAGSSANLAQGTTGASKFSPHMPRLWSHETQDGTQWARTPQDHP